MVKVGRSGLTSDLIIEVSVIDDGRIESLGMLLNDVKVGLRNHRGRQTVGLHVVKVGHHLAEDLLRLLVQVGNHDSSRKDGVV
jgi:hypothetical protein